MNLLSRGAAGGGAGTDPRVGVYTLNRIMIFAQAAHLERWRARRRTTDVRRAAYVREALAAGTATLRGVLNRQQKPPSPARHGRCIGRSGSASAACPNAGRAAGGHGDQA